MIPWQLVGDLSVCNRVVGLIKGSVAFTEPIGAVCQAPAYQEFWAVEAPQVC